MAATELVDDIDPTVVALVARAKDGDAEAFAGLYDRYVDRVYGYVHRRVRHRQVAEDLTADVFLRAYRGLPRFEWHGVDPAAWLLTIARNRVIDHVRSAPVRLERARDVAPDEPDHGVDDDPERVTVGRDMTRALGEALEALSPDHREVIELRFVHDCSVAVTAKVMGRSVDATKALQYRALKALAAEVRDVPGLSEIAALGIAGSIAMIRLLL